MSRPLFGRLFPRRRKSNSKRKTRAFRPLIENLESRRVLANTYVVTTTADTVNDDDFLSLREATQLSDGTLTQADFTSPFVLSNIIPDGNATDTIKFDFYYFDSRHRYYRDDGIAGHVTLGNVATTATIDDGDIPDIDPDWQHSWYSIRLGSELPINVSMTIDGFSAALSKENTNPVGQGLNSILRVEIDGGGAGGFLRLQAADLNETVIRGLAINHGADGIQVSKIMAWDMSNIRIEGNYIGTDISGTHIFNDVGSGDYGSNGIQTLITVFTPGFTPPQVATHIIGGTTPAARNLISGNRYAFLSNDVVYNFTATIEGNLIGTNRAGTSLLDDAGNQILGNERGFYIIRTPATYIVGGPTPDSANVISGNTVGALVDTTSAATLRNNLIGTDPTGLLDVGNAAVGVLLRSGKNIVQENIIAFNGKSPPSGTPSGFTEPAGMRVYVLPGGNGQLNVFTRNSIFSNFGEGLDLHDDGVTPNDIPPLPALPDQDTGPNSLQNFPDLVQAINANGTTSISGTLSSTPNTTFRIEFYSTPTLGMFRSGKTYLGFLDVTTDANGVASILFNLPVQAMVGEVISSTATRLDAMLAPVETSEFSAPVLVEQLTVSIDNVTVVEGNAGTVDAVFTVTLSHSPVFPVTITVGTADDTATLANNDYQQISGLVLTFLPGDPISQTVTVVVNSDVNVELDETFLVNLSNPTNVDILDGQGVGSITNEDYPGVSIDDVTVNEPENGTVSATFTITLTEAPLVPLSVTVNTADGTATLLDIDYQKVTNQVVTFMPGEGLTKTVTVLVNGDLKVETDENFFVQLSNPVNAMIVDGEGEGTITNEDFAEVRINDVSIVEGDNGTKNAVFTVTLSQAPAELLQVTVNTSDGTAMLVNGDYQAVINTVLSWMPGDPLTQTVTVVINGDEDIELDETFTVVLSVPVKADIVDGIGLGTIVNDDFPGVSIDDVEIVEGESGTTNAVFTVKITDNPLAPLSITVNTHDGTAKLSDSDYQAIVNKVLTFEPGGSLTQTVIVKINGEQKYEGDEYFFVRLTNPVNATIVDGEGEGTIVTDDVKATLAKDILVLGSEIDGDISSAVKLVDIKNGNQTMKTFRPYGADFHGGVRVAIGDINNDGIAEVITAPGPGRIGTVKVYNLNGQELTEYRTKAYPNAFIGGVFVALADVNDDGMLDIITTPGQGRRAEVKVFRTRDAAVYADPIVDTPMRTFLAFGSTFTGGVSVAAGDLTGDGKAEVVVGSGKGISPYVRAFDLTTFSTTGLAPRLLEFSPFSSSQRNGVYVAVGDIRGNSTPEIIVGSSTNTLGQIKLYNADGTRFKTINAYTDSGNKRGPVHVAAKDINQVDDLMEVVSAQGFTGNRHRRTWEPDGALIDDVLENDPSLFRGYFIA